MITHTHASHQACHSCLYKVPLYLQAIDNHILIVWYDQFGHMILQENSKTIFPPLKFVPYLIGHKCDIKDFV